MKRAAPLLLLFLLTPATARAYIEDTPSLGRLVKDSANVFVLEVVKVSKDKGVIVFRKLADLKGNAAGEARHHIGAGLHPREPRQILDWAEPGKVAVGFQAGKTAQICLGQYWYECVALDEAPWWRMTRGVPERALAYFGSASRLRGHVAAMLAGKEVVITAVTQGTTAFRGYEPVAYKDLVPGRGFPVWRLRASLHMPRNVYLTGTDPKYVVGLGAGEAGDVPPLLKALDDKDPRTRADAADELGMIGPAAKEAGPALARLAGRDADPLVAVRAAEALLRIDLQESFVNLLAAALNHERPDVRRAAAEALGNSGARALPALPKLMEAAKDSDGAVRWAAVVALGHLGPAAKAAVPALAAALEDPVLQNPAADALGAIGPDARAAVPALARVIAAGDKNSRWAAAVALVRIGEAGSEAATPVLTEALKSNDVGTRWDALCYLQRLGPRGAAAAPTVVALFLDPDAFIRELAVVTVGKLGPRAKAAVSELLPLLGGDDEDLRPRAAVSLAEIGSAALPGLIDQLNGKNPDARTWAAVALERMGPPAAGAGPALAERLRRDPDASARGAAAAALGAIGAEPKLATEALTAGLRDPEARVRILAAESLTRVDKTPDQGLAVLGKELGSRDVAARRDAAEALGRLKGRAGPALTGLRKLLEDPVGEVRVAAAQAVWLISGQADGVPVLTAALGDRDAETRRAAAEALGSMGAPAKGALAALGRAVRDKQPAVRKAAAEAMRKIDPEGAAQAGVP